MNRIFDVHDINSWRVSGSVNWYNNKIDAFETTLLFPLVRTLTLQASEDDTWDFKINNQITLPWQIEAQLSFVYYAERNIAQGRQHARSSLDVGLKKPILAGKGEVIFSFSDVFNEFGIKQDIDGQGFSAIYENYYETQTISLGMKYMF